MTGWTRLKTGRGSAAAARAAAAAGGQHPASKQQPGAVGGDDADKGGDRSPFSELHQFFQGAAIPTDPVTAARQPEMTDRRVEYRADQGAYDKAPDRSGGPGNADGDALADHHLGQFDDSEP